MAGSIRLAGSLWSVAPDDLEREASRLAHAGLRVWHWDRADGTLGVAGGFMASEAHRLAEATGLASEAHLMLADPLDELDDWLAFCERVVVHVEARGWREALDRIVASGREGAVAISPGTALAGVDVPPSVSVLVMSVHPGQGGGAFLDDTTQRISTLAPSNSVGVDGGVTIDRARESWAAGARWIVSGTALISAVPPQSWVQSIGELTVD